MSRMEIKRTRHANGSLVLNDRANGEHVWYFRYKDAASKYKGVQVGTIKQFRTKSLAWKEVDRLGLKAKYLGVAQAQRSGRKTFGALIALYKDKKMPQRFSTKHSYESWINLHIFPKWQASFVDEIDPSEVEDWLAELTLAPKSRAHIRGLMSVLFKYSMKLKWIPRGVNPMEFVTVEGATKRETRPDVLTPEQFAELLCKIEEPYLRVVLIVSMCLGLRFSEALGLKWGDINWKQLTVKIERGVVLGRIGPVKTEYSDAPAPLDPELAEELLEWHRATEFAKDGDWIFASPFQAGQMPYFPTGLRNKVHAAGKLAGISDLLEGEPTKIMRHSYRAWLGDTDTPLAVIKDLMRHADIRTTMNVYGNGLAAPMRHANSKVVKMVLKTG